MWVDKGERRLVDVEGVVDKRVLGELRIDAVYLAVFLRIIEVKLYIPAEGRKSVRINYYDRIESTHPIRPYPNDWSCCRCQLSIYILETQKETHRISYAALLYSVSFYLLSRCRSRPDTTR